MEAPTAFKGYGHNIATKWLPYAEINAVFPSFFYITDTYQINRFNLQPNRSPDAIFHYKTKNNKVKKPIYLIVK